MYGFHEIHRCQLVPAICVLLEAYRADASPQNLPGEHRHTQLQWWSACPSLAHATWVVTKGNQINSSWLALLTLLLIFQLLFRHKPPCSPRNLGTTSQVSARCLEHQGSPGDFPLPDLSLHFTPASLEFCFGLLESIAKRNKDHFQNSNPDERASDK